MSNHPLSTVFALALMKVTLVMVALMFGYGLLHSDAPSSAQEAKVEAPNGASVDYRGDLDRWTVGGAVVPLECPEEDSCEVQRVGTTVWVYRP